MTYAQGIWIGTPWIGAIQNSGLFWIEIWIALQNGVKTPECNPKLRAYFGFGLWIALQNVRVLKYPAYKIIQ